MGGCGAHGGAQVSEGGEGGEEGGCEIGDLWEGEGGD